MQKLQDKEPVNITTPQLMGYRGEVKAKFYYDNVNKQNKFYKVGERCMQIIIMPYPNIKFVEVAELSESFRGTGGFGSSGK